MKHTCFFNGAILSIVAFGLLTGASAIPVNADIHIDLNCHRKFVDFNEIEDPNSGSFLGDLWGTFLDAHASDEVFNEMRWVLYSTEEGLRVSRGVFYETPAEEERAAKEIVDEKVADMNAHMHHLNPIGFVDLRLESDSGRYAGSPKLRLDDYVTEEFTVSVSYDNGNNTLYCKPTYPLASDLEKVITLLQR